MTVFAVVVEQFFLFKIYDPINDDATEPYTSHSIVIVASRITRVYHICMIMLNILLNSVLLFNGKDY